MINMIHQELREIHLLQNQEEKIGQVLEIAYLLFIFTVPMLYIFFMLSSSTGAELSLVSLLPVFRKKAHSTFLHLHSDK